jgi:hypothetical protein
MHVTLEVQDITAKYIVIDLDPIYYEAAGKIGFTQEDEGLVHTFSASSPYLELAYHNFKQYGEAIILQKAGVILAPWQEALMTFLKLVDHQPIEWYLVGSGALAVRGIDVQPGDLDLVTGEADALVLAELAKYYLIEPVRDASGWVGKWFVRTYMGAVVEWLGGVNESADAHGDSDFGPAALARTETIEWQGYQIQVPPLNLQLEVNEKRGRADVAAKIRRALAP